MDFVSDLSRYKAEREKFSEEIHKQYTTDYVEQSKDEFTDDEHATVEEKVDEALEENFESCEKAEAPLQTVEVEGAEADGASDDPATITAEDEENRDVVSQEDEGLESQEDQTRFVMAKLLWIKQTTPATKLAEAIVHLLRDLKDGVTNNCTQRDVRNKVDLMIKRPPDMTRPAQYRTPEQNIEQPRSKL